MRKLILFPKTLMVKYLAEALPAYIHIRQLKLEAIQKLQNIFLIATWLQPVD